MVFFKSNLKIQRKLSFENFICFSLINYWTKTSNQPLRNFKTNLYENEIFSSFFSECESRLNGFSKITLGVPQVLSVKPQKDQSAVNAPISFPEKQRTNRVAEKTEN